MCEHCQQGPLVRNGHSATKKQRYLCQGCGFRGTVGSRHLYSKAKKQEIMSAYQERMSLRGIERVFGVMRSTVCRACTQSKIDPGSK